MSTIRNNDGKQGAARRMLCCAVVLAVSASCVVLLSPIASAQNYKPLPQLGETSKTSTTDVNLESGITPQLGVKLDGTLPFYDELGRHVALGDYLKSGKPVILQLGYFQCPMLCGQVLNGMLKSFKDIEPSLASDFEVISISIDPKETATLAAQKRLSYTRDYGRPEAQAGWHFLTGPQESITALANAVGFKYHFDQAINQFSHGSGIIFLTPDGTTSQYLGGIEYPADDVTAALANAGQQKVASSVADFLRMLCYHYDPATNAYSLSVLKMVRLMGGITVALLFGTVALFLVQERRKRSKAALIGEAPVQG